MLTIHLLVLAQLKTSAKQPVVWFGIGRSMMTRFSMQVILLGFKGGGFNPPFNAAQFPNTPFAFESTEVDAFEFGVKASVPEEGIVANASIYYYDFTNYHIGVIRNETAINTGMPLETMGAELEFYLTPPSLPGLSFNMMFSYQTSEVGNFSMINPHDLGGHYRKQASTGSMDGYTDWHCSEKPNC